LAAKNPHITITVKPLNPHKVPTLEYSLVALSILIFSFLKESGTDKNIAWFQQDGAGLNNIQDLHSTLDRALLNRYNKGLS
jgi:hypothetical protein